MQTEKRKTGDFGEDAAVEYLTRAGMKIIKRNYFCRTGEIDIIAADGSCTVFVEVKTRKNAAHGTAAEFVNYAKQQRIIKTALYYAGGDIEMRFDVVEVYYRTVRGERVVTGINHIKNAFC